MHPTPPTSPNPLVSEIRLLLDYVAGSSTRSLKHLTMADPDQAPSAPIGKLLSNVEILDRLNDIEAKLPTATTPVLSKDHTFLLFLRDALVGMVQPATGLTVAYTSMVVGRLRGPGATSRAMWAIWAYPDLAAYARRHRASQYVLLVLAAAVALFAVWQSAHVALGRSLLQGIQTLETQQVALSQDMTKLLEANRPKAPPTTILTAMEEAGIPLQAAPILRLCERPRAIAWAMQNAKLTPIRLGPTDPATLFESPAQQALCDRDTILATRFIIAHATLLEYRSAWWSVVAPGDTLLVHISDALQGTRPPAAQTPPSDLLPAITTAATAAEPQASTGRIPRPDTGELGRADLDFAIAPVLLILGNYVLPIVFALLGAAVYVILDFYSKLRDSLLAPRDFVLSWIRLVLGMVLGACVGLFFSSANPSLLGAAPAGAALADSITLSASGLAFIAGFGVEGVFGMLDTLVRRIFSADQDKTTRLSPG